MEKKEKQGIKGSALLLIVPYCRTIIFCLMKLLKETYCPLKRVSEHKNNR